MIWERTCDDLRSASDAAHLFKLVSTYARENGFDFCTYSMSIPAVNSKSRFILFDNCPTGWNEHYKAKNYHEIDPAVRQGMKSICPIIWSDTLFADVPQLKADAQSFGLNAGIALPCWAAHGVFGLLSFLRSHRPVSEAELSFLRTKMQVMGNLLHVSMYELLEIEKISAMPNVNLTAREREILRWTSEGKTAEIIGKILNISTRTVNFHISNVLLKLMSVNKVQAVVKAQTLGLL